MATGFADAFLESVFKTRAENAERQRFNTEMLFRNTELASREKQAEAQRSQQAQQFGQSLDLQKQEATQRQKQFEEQQATQQQMQAIQGMSQGYLTPGGLSQVQAPPMTPGQSQATGMQAQALTGQEPAPLQQLDPNAVMLNKNPYRVPSMQERAQRDIDIQGEQQKALWQQKLTNLNQGMNLLKTEYPDSFLASSPEAQADLTSFALFGAKPSHPESIQQGLNDEIQQYFAISRKKGAKPEEIQNAKKRLDEHIKIARPLLEVSANAAWANLGFRREQASAEQRDTYDLLNELGQSNVDPADNKAFATAVRMAVTKINAERIKSRESLITPDTMEKIIKAAGPNNPKESTGDAMMELIIERIKANRDAKAKK